MKKILLSFSALAAMLATIATFSACSSDDEQQEPTTRSLLTLNADKSNYFDAGESGTRALSLSDDKNTITTSWVATEVVTVYKDNWKTKIGELNPKPDKVPASSSPQRTKLEGFITYNNLKAGDALNLIFPRPDWSYTGQKGTIEDISSNFDYITTTISVVYIDPTNQDNPVYSTTALFGKAHQSIVRFTLLKPDGGDLEVQELSITTAGNQLVKKCSLDGTATDKGGALVITSTTATNVFYVAIRNDNEGADEYTLTVKDSAGKIYTYTKSGVNFERGNYKKVKVTMGFHDNTYTERDAYYNEDGEEVWQ